MNIIKNKRLWISDLLKIFLYSTQKRISFKCLINLENNFIDINYEILAVNFFFDFKLVKILINGLNENDTINLFITKDGFIYGVSFKENIIFNNFNNIIIFLENDSKKFYINFNNKKFDFLSPAQTINFIENII